ncbi:MAG: MBL fold metallo-hydrolase [Spirochaetes bacterium]|nr:MBL fold metallo-hydrolase [Spirochaetota bacterium]
MINLNTVPGGSLLTNAYILEEDKRILLIDFVPEIEKIIEKNKYSIDKLLLTHIHFDHIEGLSDFQKKYSFELGLSEAGYKFIKNPDYELLAYFPPDVKENIDNINLDKAIIYKDNDIINWNNHILKVIKSPGHSPDCMMYIFEEKKLVFTGDTIFYGSVGRTDLPGGNFNEMISSINNLFLQVSDDFTLYPGHGPKTNVEFEKKNNPFITVKN